MLLFGHRFLSTQPFYHIESIEAIRNTPPNALLYLHFSEENLDIINHLQQNHLSFALVVETITQIIYASALGARYIVVSKKMAKSAQDIAENYLFDAKILAIIESDDEIEELAILGIDGVLFANAVVKITS